MKLINRSGNGLSHLVERQVYFIANGAVGDVPDAVAKVWLKIKGVEEYADVEELKKIKAELEEVKKEVKKPAVKKTTAKKTTKKKTK